MSSVMLRTGPLYFHDQLKTKTIKRAKKLPEELPSDMKYLNINPRLANFINSLNKNNKKGAAAHVEIKQETLPKEDTVRKEKYPVLPEIFGSNLSKSNVDNPNPKTSHTLADEEQFMNPFEEYKYAAPSLLYELGKLLHFFSQYEIILPQGVVNVLNYSWMELIKGTVYTKRNWQSLAYKRVRTSTSLAPEECDSKLTGPGTAPENVESIKNNKNTASATVAESGKEKWVQETAQNKPTGHKSTQGFASNLPVTISFSMSSRACEDKGWISEQQGSKSEDLEWKVLYAWAVERLQLAQIQM